MTGKKIFVAVVSPPPVDDQFEVAADTMEEALAQVRRALLVKGRDGWIIRGLQRRDLS